MLSFIEVLSVLLVFFLAVARTSVSRQPPAPYHFLYKHSVVDIVGLACTRAALLSIAYAVGLRMGHRCGNASNLPNCIAIQEHQHTSNSTLMAAF